MADLVLTMKAAIRGDAASAAADACILPGVVDAAAVNGGVKVRYDPRRIRAADIEAALAARGHLLRDGLLTRLRRNWRDFQEANRLAQAEMVPHCCNSLPTAAPDRRGRDA